MKRDIDEYLVRWKDSPEHLPILLRGARQVGKSYAVESFGKQYFQSFVVVNFEFQPELKSCFETLDPKKIIPLIELLTNSNIIPGKTLLFLDEIQECPNAIMALRYFKEKLPELHVISAGSLLEFVLNSNDFRMPVGRIQFYFLKPLSFKEYLSGLHHEKLRDFIESVSLKDGIPEAVHTQLLQLVKEYCVLGGMPAVLNTFMETNSMRQAQDRQSVILTTYKSDFGKYAAKVSVELMQKIFNKAPSLVTKQLKYVEISREIQAREIKNALSKLVHANILYQVQSTSASGLPLGATVNPKKFKLLFLDTGLVERTTRLEAETLLQNNLLLINQGAIAEQFVGQELLAYSDPLIEPEVYFWERDKKNASAEVDYVINNGGNVIPIEVKSGSAGRLKSIQMFLKEKNYPFGIKISSSPMELHKNILSLPLYLTSEVGRLTKVLS